jgi:hypothetical protein
VLSGQRTMPANSGRPPIGPGVYAPVVRVADANLMVQSAIFGFDTDRTRLTAFRTAIGGCCGTPRSGA